METYRIVVPSRRRIKRMPELLTLLPTALVCVAEEEAKAYLEVVPKGQLITHNEPNLIAIRNWILAKVQEDCVVQVDDDLQCVRLLTKAKGTPAIKDPLAIRRIIENAHHVCVDLDVGVFGWSRTLNAKLINVRDFPIRVAAPIAAAYGIRGSARARRFDPHVVSREDFDFTLQTLLEDRIVYVDMRFYFDHGRSYSGTGGNAGRLDTEEIEMATARIKRKWGKWASTSKPAYKRNRAHNIDSMSIRVPRRNPAIESGQ